MKILALSDTHNWLYDIDELPEADVLVHAGDALISGNREEWGAFCTWLHRAAERYPCVIYVPGNHDRMFSGIRDLEFIEEAKPAHVLINRTLTYDGFTFLGSPVMVAKDDDIRAYYWHEHLRKAFWENLWAVPHDVVVTHSPAYGTLDLARGDNLGCEYLAGHLSRTRPLLHIHGHIHQANGYELTSRYTSVNAAVCNLETQPVNPLWLITLTKTGVTNIEPIESSTLNIRR